MSERTGMLFLIGMLLLGWIAFWHFFREDIGPIVPRGTKLLDRYIGERHKPPPY